MDGSTLAKPGQPTAKPRPGRVGDTTRTTKASPNLRAGALPHPTPLEDPSKHYVSIQIVRLADDDGGRGSYMTKATAEQAIARMNEIWSRNDGDIRFRLHPASNFDDHVQSTLLNSDCLLQPGFTPQNIENITAADLDGNGEGGKIEDMDKLCDTTTSVVARTSYAARRADRITVFSRGGRFRVRYNNSLGHWEYHKVANSAGHKGLYVNLTENTTGDVLGHEVGHFLHLAHTFGSRPATQAQATSIIGNWGTKNPNQPPTRIFDADSHNRLKEDGIQIFDTPADPGPGLWTALFGDRCDLESSSVTLYPQISGKTKAVVLAPDRGNLMSYFGKCEGIERHLSRGQLAMSTKALETGNRTELVATKGKSKCYEQGYAPSSLASDKQELADILAGIAQCRFGENITKHPVPWNPATYRKAAGRLPRGFSRRGTIAVHRDRERAMIEAMIRTPLVP